MAMAEIGSVAERFSEDDLWAAREGSGRRAAVAALVDRYRHLVSITVYGIRGKVPAQVETGDLESAGLAGLLAAIKTFDPDRGFKFETLALHKIRGKILDYLRAQDRRPRNEKRRLRAVQNTAMTLEMAGERPTPERIAERLGVSVEEVLITLEKRGAPPLSIELLAEQEAARQREHEERSDSLRSEADTFQEAIKRVRAGELARAIEALPERQRQVICLYYYEHKTGSEIGRLLQISEARANQIIRDGVASLARSLQGRRALFE